jgi:hypothetical protein
MEGDTEHYVQYPTYRACPDLVKYILKTENLGLQSPGVPQLPGNPYKGDYQIKGTTSEGRKLSAITSYYLLQPDKISLNDVSLGNTSDLNKENIIEARYSLANLPELPKI